VAVDASLKSRWQTKDGWLAVLTFLFFVEAIFAGNDRSCMPSFSLRILAGQLLLYNVLGVPEIATLVAGIPAFFFAACPAPRVILRRPLVWGLACVTVIALYAVLSGNGTGDAIRMIFAAVASGVAIGLGVRYLRRIRVWVLPMAFVAACLLGAIIFSFGQYGQANCWP
jgi:hypothetical protein